MLNVILFWLQSIRTECSKPLTIQYKPSVERVIVLHFQWHTISPCSGMKKTPFLISAIIECGRFYFTLSLLRLSFQTKLLVITCSRIRAISRFEICIPMRLLVLSCQPNRSCFVFNQMAWHKKGVCVCVLTIEFVLVVITIGSQRDWLRESSHAGATKQTRHVITSSALFVCVCVHHVHAGDVWW